MTATATSYHGGRHKDMLSDRQQREGRRNGMKFRAQGARFESIRVREEARKDFLRWAGLVDADEDRELMLKCANEVEI